MVTRYSSGGSARSWGASAQDPIDDYLQFREELRTALRTRTPVALRAVVRRWAGPRDAQLAALVAQPDAMLEPIIHRMILEEPQLAELHDEARLWLIRYEPTPVRPRHIAPTDRRRMPRHGPTN